MIGYIRLIKLRSNEREKLLFPKNKRLIKKGGENVKVINKCRTFKWICKNGYPRGPSRLERILPPRQEKKREKRRKEKEDSGCSWLAQWVEHLIVGFISGHDLRAVGLRRLSDSMLRGSLLEDSLPFPLPPPHSCVWLRMCTLTLK